MTLKPYVIIGAIIATLLVSNITAVAATTKLTKLIKIHSSLTIFCEG
jgi:hypothetical protein